MRNAARLMIVVMFLLCTGGVAIQASADGGKTYHFGFKKSSGGKLPSIAEEGFMSTLQKHGAVFLGDTDKKEVYLTFDNGYENGYTAPILDVLKQKNAPAVFFVTGHYVQTQGDLLNRMVEEGHLVGNHTWHHPNMTQLSAEQIKDELRSVELEVGKRTNQKEMRFMRPPMGIFDDRMLSVAGELNYTNVFWSVAYLDWDVKNQKGESYAYRKIMDQLHPGAVILLHSISKDNMHALGKIIDDARGQGYEFKRLDQMEVKRYR